MVLGNEVSAAFYEIQQEFARAKSKYTDNFNSNHEGFAVLLEEVDELWDEIKKKNPSNEKLREEAVQIGAMAIRFISELTDEAIPEFDKE